MYGIYANIGGILMVNVTIYGIHGSYGFVFFEVSQLLEVKIIFWKQPDRILSLGGLRQRPVVRFGRFSAGGQLEVD